jgi:flagellar motor switch protein FliN/FliY
MAEDTTPTPPPAGGQEHQVNELSSTAAAGPARSIDFLLDVPLSMSVELGRTRMLVNDLLQLGQGSVVELTKFVGEPLEVMVNEKLIARGEVVVLNDKFAVRLTDIISPKDRLDKLA